MTKQNYIRVATQVGDLLKHNSLVFISDINMKGEQILLGARKDNLDPKTNIEPERKARLIYNWIMSLYETAIDPDSDPDIKNGMLVDFCMAITPQYSREELKKNTY